MRSFRSERRSESSSFPRLEIINGWSRAAAAFEETTAAAVTVDLRRRLRRRRRWRPVAAKNIFEEEAWEEVRGSWVWLLARPRWREEREKEKKNSITKRETDEEEDEDSSRDVGLDGEEDEKEAVVVEESSEGRPPRRDSISAEKWFQSWRWIATIQDRVLRLQTETTLKTTTIVDDDDDGTRERGISCFIQTSLWFTNQQQHTVGFLFKL